MVVTIVVLHYVFRAYRTPSDEEIDVLSTFFATFASTILTFFVGALLFDYQVERTDTRRFQQLRLLLAAEFSEILEALDPTNAVEVQLPDDSAAEVVVAYVQPVNLGQAVRDGFFAPRTWEPLYIWRARRAATAPKPRTSCRTPHAQQQRTQHPAF